MKPSRRTVGLAVVLSLLCVGLAVGNGEMVGGDFAKRKEAAQAQIKSLEGQIKQSVKAKVQKDSENLQLKADLSTASFAVSQLQLEVSALSRTRAGLVGALRSLEKEERKLQGKAFASANEARQAAQERKSIAAKQSVLEKQIAELEASRKGARARIKVQAAEIQRLGKQLAKAQADLSTATKAYRDRDEDLAQLVSAADAQRSTLLSEVKELLRQKDVLAKRAAALQDKLQALTQERTKMREQVDMMRHSVDELQAELKAQSLAADAAEKALGEFLLPLD